MGRGNCKQNTEFAGVVHLCPEEKEHFNELNEAERGGEMQRDSIAGDERIAFPSGSEKIARNLDQTHDSRVMQERDTLKGFPIRRKGPWEPGSERRETTWSQSPRLFVSACITAESSLGETRPMSGSRWSLI
jgi:hypothetical protein